MPSSRIDDRWHRKDRTRTERYGKGRRWQAVWVDAAGVEKKQSFSVKGQAEAHLDVVAADRARGLTGLAPDQIFSDYAATWRSRQLHQRPGSLGNIDTRLKLNIIPAFDGKTVRGIERGDVQEAVAKWQSAGLAPATIRVAYTYTAGIFAEAVLDRIVHKSPCQKIKLPPDVRPRIVPLSTGQVQSVVEAIHAPYRPAVVFAAATGMRPGEWRGLTVDRVDLGGGLVTVDRQYAGDSAREPRFGPLKTMASYRVIKIGPSTVAMLEQIVQSPGPGGLVFHTAGAGITRGKASAVWRSVRDVYPWAGDGWHQLRHHHASLLIAGGASPVAVAHRLGHKDATETLQTYSHLWPDDDAKLATLSDGLLQVCEG